MTDKRWNDDIAYVFSTHRFFLGLYGLWPLQKKTGFTKIQWSFGIISQLAMILLVTMDFFWNNQDANSNIEYAIYVASAMVAGMRILCFVICQKKLGTNINAAIDDWVSAKDNKEIERIMKKYAVKAKILTLTLLYGVIMFIAFYIAVVIFMNRQQLFFTDDSVNVNTNWVLLVPSGPLSNSISSSQFVIVMIIQAIQAYTLSFILCMTDSFFFNIAMHLSGQLVVLKNKLETFANEPDIEINYRRKFVRLINRHSELMELYQNLEDSFHVLILLQLMETTIVLALSGLRLNIYLNENNNIEAMKSACIVVYLLMQSFVYTYCGEFLQTESEGIFYALYASSWVTLPLVLMKDLRFTMMRSSIPLRFTGGKFFYVNRETMMNILKTAASYVSVLRIAIQKYQ